MASEFALIRTFLASFDLPAGPAGPGDDCAVLPGFRGKLCVTTDAVVSGVHFRCPPFSLADVGHKALAVNLSDLAAAGAEPAWFVCAFALPSGVGAKEVRALASGMSPLAREHRIALVGGNFTRARELSVTITAAGTVRRGRALLRSGGRPGDLLYVSGTLGDARLGLEELARRPRSFAALRQKRPVPRVRLGLLARRFASAAIDLSDGFAQDLGHLCRASRVGARVELFRLPISAAVRARFADSSDAARFAAAGGEDYELLVAVPPRRAGAFEAACRQGGHRVTQVGALTTRPQVWLELPGGGRLAPPPGYDHFAGERARGAI